ncbi:MAG TPA: LysM domain-containing protein [Candidatus Limnocylindrales bacterium]|nr:LysM domain-containing protein [Candidatus Limnocylindrales bacterium]
MPSPSGSTAPTARPPIVRPTPTPAPTFLVYVVKSGDSLNTIAHRFGTTARSIAFWNRSTYPSLDPESPGYRPNLLKLGWTLFLVPNDVVDEQDLPDPAATGPTDATAAPTDAAAIEDPAAPEDSAIPE